MKESRRKASKQEISSTLIHSRRDRPLSSCPVPQRQRPREASISKVTLEEADSSREAVTEEASAAASVEETEAASEVAIAAALEGAAVAASVEVAVGIDDAQFN